MFATRLARTVLTLAGLVAFALWLPIATVAYVPGWHSAGCHWHARCAGYDDGRAPDDGAQQRITELRHYMQHRGELPAQAWTAKESAHLAEVRGMLDRAALLALLGVLVFLHADAREQARAALRAMVGIGACALVLPFFGNFWRDVFHPLLFSNRLWLNTPADTSWWLMPRIYFEYTTALVIAGAVVLCALARWQALRRAR